MSFRSHRRRAAHGDAHSCLGEPSRRLRPHRQPAAGGGWGEVWGEEAEGGPAGAAHSSVPGPDGGAHPAAGAVGARQGEASEPHRVPGHVSAEEQVSVRRQKLIRSSPA